ncbi:MAG: ABC transporter permease subunit, partial [Devosia sp.]
MDFDYIIQALPALLSGLMMTIMVSFLAVVFSLFMGLVGTVLRLTGFKPFQYLVTAFVEFIRGTPYLVQIFFIFYGLPAMGLKLSIFWSGVVALSLWASAFHIENFRAGLTAVGRGIQ